MTQNVNFKDLTKKFVRMRRRTVDILDSAAPSSEIFPLTGFVENTSIFSLETGGYGCLLRPEGIDSDGLDRKSLNRISSNYQAVLHGLPDDCLLYEYLISKKRPKLLRRTSARGHISEQIHNARLDMLDREAGFKTVELRMCLYIPGPNRWEDLNPFAYGQSKSNQLRKLQTGATLFQRQMSRICDVALCTPDETAEFFSYLLTLDDRFAVKSVPEIPHRLSGVWKSWSPLTIGRQRVKAFSLLDRPKSGTRPDLWGDLMSIEPNFVMCQVWNPQTSGDVKGEAEQQDLATGNGLVSGTAIAKAILVGQGDPAQEATRIRSAAERSTDRAIDSISQILDDVREGKRFGYLSLYGIIFGEQPSKLDDAITDIQRMVEYPSGARIVEEGVGELTAYLAMFPGQYGEARRRHWLRSDHKANISPIYKPFDGLTRKHREENCTQVFQGERREAFFYHARFTQNGNTAVVAPPRSGKTTSVIVNMLGEHRLGGYTYVIDVGGSYDFAVEKLGGKAFGVGLDGPRMAPFDSEETPENIEAITLMVLQMLRLGGVEVNHTVESSVREKVIMIYSLDPELRRFGLLVKFLPPKLGAALHKWTYSDDGKRDDGAYAAIFDNVRDETNMDLYRIQSFDFKKVKDDNNTHGSLIQMVIFWLFYRIGQMMADPARMGLPKTVIAEEIATHVKDERMMSFLISSLKTDPKNGGRLVIVMHLEEDLGKFGPTIRNACPNTFFLGGDVDKDFWGLNDEQHETISNLTMGHLCLHVRGNGGFFKRLILNMDPMTLAITTTTPEERAERKLLIDAHGLDAGLEELGRQLASEKKFISAAAGS